MTIMEQLYLEEASDLKDVSDTMGDAFVSLDSEWRFRYVNNKALYLTAKTREQLLGRNVWEIFPDLVGTIFDFEYRKVMDQRQEASFEVFYKRCSMWLEVRAYPQEGGICIFYSDVTEKKKLARESQEITQRFQLYAKMNPFGIFHTDSYGNCLFVNDKWIELTGLTAAEAAGRGWMQALHEEDRANVHEHWKDTIRTGKSLDQTYRFKNKETGLTLQTHIMATPVREDGRVNGYVGTVEDITEKVKADEIISESEKWFRNVANNAPVMIFSLGPDKEWTYCNNTWLEYSGRTYEEEMASEWINDVYPDDRERISRICDESFGNRWEFRTEYRMRYRDNSYRWVSVTGKPLHAPDQTFLGFIGTCMDIHEQVMVYQELERRVAERTHECTVALEREKEVHHLKSRFVSMASHEFRTPLTTILSSVELMQTYIEINEPQHLQKHVDRIKTSVKHLRGVLDDFLSIEELEQGNVKDRKAVFNLQTYISETVDEVEGLLKRGQRIRCFHRGDHKINSDKEIIDHILFNLLSNAIKYSDDDVILETEAKDDEICVSIIDKGIGIPVEEQKDLFNNYFRASNVGIVKGTGLGLSIVKRYIKILNGSIDFTSMPGSGSTFRVRFPRNLQDN